MFQRLKNFFCKKSKENKIDNCRNCNVNYPNKCPQCSLKKEGEESQFTNK